MKAEEVVNDPLFAKILEEMKSGQMSHDLERQMMVEAQMKFMMAILDRTDKMMARQDQTIDRLLGIISTLAEKKIKTEEKG